MALQHSLPRPHCRDLSRDFIDVYIPSILTFVEYRCTMSACWLWILHCVCMFACCKKFDWGSHLTHLTAMLTCDEYYNIFSARSSHSSSFIHFRLKLASFTPHMQQTFELRKKWKYEILMKLFWYLNKAEKTNECFVLLLHKHYVVKGLDLKREMHVEKLHEMEK